MFFSLSTRVFANPCEEAFSSGAGGVFISFLKGQMGKEFEIGLSANWTEKITENTKHWTRVEALQFLNFLNNRSGELSSVEYVKSFADSSHTISFKDFMNKVNFYDRINKDIVDELLMRDRERGFRFLLTNNTINEVTVRQIGEIMESYIGETGASYLMGDLILERGSELNNFNPKEMKKVMNFVDRYTKKHGVTSDTLDSRVNFFRQFISLPQGEQHRSRITLRNFDELKEFSKLIFEALREEEGKISATVGQFYSSRKILTFSLRSMIRAKITNLLSAYYDSKLSDLKKVVKIFEQYISPEGVAYMLMNKVDIYMVNPKHLKEVVDLLEETYSVHWSLQKYVDEGLLMNHMKESNRELTLQDKKEVIETLNKTPKEFISHIMKTRVQELLSTNPAHLRDTIIILENYVSEVGIALILRLSRYGRKGYENDLLMVNSYYLKRIITVLEKYFERNEMIDIVGNYFSAMGRIKESDSFAEIVAILNARIDQKSVFLQRVEELFEISYDFFPLNLIPEVRDELVELSNTLDHRQVKKILIGTHISKFSSTIQDIRNMEGEEQPKSAALH